MQKQDIKVCVLRIEGTNCEDETKRAFEELGVFAEIVHLKQLIKSPGIKRELCRDLFDYHILMFPGGFSSGDYVRAGAILAARIKKYLGAMLIEFIENGYAVGGICNGFQVMVDGREKAPAKAHRNMYLDDKGNVLPGASINGPLAAGIPGVPAAIVHIAKKYGRLPLAKSLAPAIRLARDGFAVDEQYRR